MVLLCLLALLLPAGILCAQPALPDALQPAPPDWHSIELHLPPDKQQALLDAAFRDEELRLIHTRTPDVLASIHIADVDLDGRPDVVYHGRNGGDIKRLVIFLGTDSGLVKAATLWGELLSMRRNSPVEPLSFTIIDYPCCSGYTLYSTAYALVRKGEVQRYEPVSCTAYTTTTTLPPQFGTPAPFLVAAPTAELRSTPEVSEFQPERLRGALPNPGNLLGIYPEGSLGVVLAEQTDAAGERWLFVRLARNKPAQQDIVHKGQNGEDHFGFLGWMREKDIAKR